MKEPPTSTPCRAPMASGVPQRMALSAEANKGTGTREHARAAPEALGVKARRGESAAVAGGEGREGLRLTREIGTGVAAAWMEDGGEGPSSSSNRPSGGTTSARRRRRWVRSSGKVTEEGAVAGVGAVFLIRFSPGRQPLREGREAGREGQQVLRKG